ncbi:acetone carboxylase [Mycobacterium koreense]|uniref:Acetone carboxylase n=1 Tax=Mycolicibacillus koreensis TaxID=1069220 RepID=A0A7I7SA54_9MYCO|nr:acetone carboxylase [Mycolicibacillus koreensis]MCV7249473.1 acetone carboxylase [Mycolicibacillus koreensis]ODR11354.1 acetone carboxylase [Mycolicibacillus koreensis]OSC35168.1 acetone carboxylase [Mycolicibacillus koreensis]BBY53390.1 hypothetical protein MKOR_06410 [Mycolicibacillus koreensis]
MTDPNPTPGPEELVCSAKGCQAPAAFQVVWNNPKIHTPDRRKIWLACPEHRQYLSEYLGRRDFLREVVPVDPDPQ